MDKDDNSQEWLTKPSSYFSKSTRGRVVSIHKDHLYYRTSNKGNIAISRLLMAEHLKRNLTKDDIVMFRNGNTTDERLDNLILLSIREFATIQIYKRLVSQLERINSKISLYREQILGYNIDPDSLSRTSPADRYWEVERDIQAYERVRRNRRSDSEEEREE